MKPSEEHQFLPAVLEIQETPPSPVGRGIIWVIIIFFISALVWAIWGKVDIVAVASGKIVPDGHVKIIQPLEIGTVSAIYVHEGQLVKKDEILIALDTSAIDAKIDQLSNELDFFEHQQKRLHWLIQYINTNQEPADFWDDSVLQSQWQTYQDQLDTLHSEQQKITAEYAAARHQMEKLTAILPIITQRSASEKKLVEKNMFPRQQYLETEQQRLTAYYDLESQKNRVTELQQTRSEITARIRHTRSEFIKSNLEKSEENKRQIHHIEQELVKSRFQLKAQRLVAPIDGIVQQLEVYTVGGIVTPAQQLMIIVPQQAQLEVEAYVENKDIGFVHEGQLAVIKLDAFPFTKYGTLKGRVIDLSDDAVSDEDQGLVYKARVGLKQPYIMVDGKQVKLGPGLAASVEIKTGRRRLIEFFLAPLLKYKHESIRER